MKSIPTRRRVAVISGIVLVGATAAWLWFAPSGDGEYADSPDGRYTAHVSKLTSGTWAGGRVTSIRITIETARGKQTVWLVERFPQPGEQTPDYGDRSQKFIKWASDSRTVAVPVGGIVDATFAVP